MAESEKKHKKRNAAGSILSFLLIMIAFVAAFYFGWVQFELPEQTYAVLFSKTNGYDKNIIEPGKFSWKWQRLLPTNSKLLKVKIETRSIVLDYEGDLPSGDLYSSVLSDNPDFSFKMEFSITYKLNQDFLPELLENGILNTDENESFFETLESEYVRIVKDSCTEYFKQNYSINNSSYIELENTILEKLQRKYYYIEIRNLTIKYIHFPDLLLYEKTRELYYQILENRKEVETATEKWAIESKVNMSTKLDILSQYGELLSKYPILIDYFALDPESQVLDISNLRDYKYETVPSGE
jgi:hypothetical protein